MGQCLLLKSGGGEKKQGKIVLFDGSNGGRNPDYPIAIRKTASIGTTEITVNKGATNNDHGAQTQNKIDVTNLKTIKMRCYTDPRDARYKMHLYLGNETDCTYGNAVLKTEFQPPNNQVYEVTLDVTSMVGSYYLFATMNPGAAYAYFAIQKWWCE